MNLEGRRALITGAAGRLGRVISETLSELGAEVVLVDVNSSSLYEFRDQLTLAFNGNVSACVCDLEKEDQRRALAQEVLSAGDLDILINNAAFVGTSDLEGWSEPFEQQTIDTWRRAIEVNLTAPFHLVQLFQASLKKSEVGSIINIASIYGLYGPDWNLYEGTQMANPAAYAASKGGLIQLTRWLATTLAPNIRVNAIAPGGVAAHQADSFVQRYEARTPLGRMATEDDLRGAIAYLAGDMSAFVTGEVLSVDGGWGAW
jgi:NAD(P)-dependent dehydrogenase (short-subunit alcohol dehydrogenase family)